MSGVEGAPAMSVVVLVEVGRMGTPEVDDLLSGVI